MPASHASDWQIVPLGDQAVLVYAPEERLAMELAVDLRASGEPWLVDVVAAYTSLAVFYDPDRSRFRDVADWLRPRFGERLPGQPTRSGRLHCIPCCYEMQLDLAAVAEWAGLEPEEIIRQHVQTEYTVFAIGFCPGFPYLGYLPTTLTGVPRLATPRLRVEAGSVGVAGRQTGVYTEPRPGGWQLIGRTPLELVNVADGFFPLRTGDRVRFERIDESEFSRLRGERLMPTES
jgi:inhibitor of KinA